MKIGFMGMGKLGLPVALAVENMGHSVVGSDPSDAVGEVLVSRKLQLQEVWAQDYLDNSQIQLVPLPDLVAHSDIIYVAIQTPHGRGYEGTERMPAERKDFDYQYLVNGVGSLSREIEAQRKTTIVVIISTVLPGTINREIKPIIERNAYFKLCYNPFFIAMGTTIRDFLHPEFVLLGVDDSKAADVVEAFYRTVHHAPVYRTTLENAEAIKVLYNTFISTKIAFANTVMEMCHKLPNTNADDVMNGLKLGNQRIISDRYLSGGMGDGGGCHPRDNIALSWLSDHLNLSYDWFSQVIEQRERQTDWFVELIDEEVNKMKKQGGGEMQVPVYVLGRAFKPGTNITTGSPAVLLRNILKERGFEVQMYDPHIDPEEPAFGRGVYFVGTKHEEFARLELPAGSVLLDPWRYLNDVGKDVRIIQIGNSR